MPSGLRLEEMVLWRVRRSLGKRREDPRLVREPDSTSVNNNNNRSVSELQPVLLIHILPMRYNNKSSSEETHLTETWWELWKFTTWQKPFWGDFSFWEWKYGIFFLTCFETLTVFHGCWWSGPCNRVTDLSCYGTTVLPQQLLRFQSNLWVWQWPQGGTVSIVFTHAWSLCGESQWEWGCEIELENKVMVMCEVTTSVLVCTCYSYVYVCVFVCVTCRCSLL